MKMNSRVQQICDGEASLPLSAVNAYRVKYGMAPLESLPDVPPVVRVIHTTKPGVLRHVEPRPRKAGCCKSPPPAGPGTELLAIYRAAKVPPCQECKDTAAKMDSWKVAGCREHIDEIVEEILPRAREWMAAQHKWIHALFGGVLEDAAARIRIRQNVNKAIDTAEKKEADTKARINTIRRSAIPGHHRKRKYPVTPVTFGPRRELKWAACFTIAPRKAESWQRSIQSCQAAGWNPVCFAEPGLLKNIDVPWIQRPETIAPSIFKSLGPGGLFGAHQNFMQTLADTLASNPDAEMILYAQDDAFFPPGSKEFLESIVWPKGAALLSLWCSSGFDYPRDQPGLCRTPKPGIIGAVAWIMPRATAEFLVTSKFMHDWQGGKARTSGHNRRVLDLATGNALAAEGRHALYFTHSIVDHFEPVAGNSSIGNGPNIGYRKSHRYVGNNATCQSMMEVYGYVQEPVHVVIPAHENVELTLSCIAAVKAQTVPVHICYVDNGSCCETVQEIRAALKGTDHSVIWNQHNAGFTKAVQQGIDRRQGRHVLLLNNDCRMQPGCLAAMLAELSGDHISSVCPVTNDQGRCSVKNPLNARLQREGTSRTSPVLPWFCCLLNREALGVIDQLPIDTEMESGLGVDDWWSRELAKRGWQHVITGQAYADHDHMTTFKALGINRGELQAAAIEWLKRE
jgi:hypothetical protein